MRAKRLHHRCLNLLGAIRFAPREDARNATAALNRVLCVAGVRIHALAPRQRTLETLYRQAAQSAMPVAS